MLRTFWTYSVRSLKRDGQRSLLAIGCVASGVVALVALQLVGGMVSAALTTDIRASNGGDVAAHSDIVPITQRQVAALERLRSLDVITDYTATSEQQAATTIQGQSQLYTVYAVDPAHFPLAGQPSLVVPGHMTFAQALRGGSVVLTSSLSAKLHTNVGSSLVVVVRDGHTIRARVGGVVANDGFFNGAKLFIAFDAYQAIPSPENAPATYTAVYANVPDHSDTDAATAKLALETLDPLATSITTANDALRHSQGQARGIRIFLQTIELLALLIAGVGIQNTMRTLLQRRLPEIAILKAVGYRQGHLYVLFGVESGLIGLCGGLAGTLIGVLLSRGFRWLIERTFLLRLSAAVNVTTLLSGLLVGCVAAWVFGMLPIIQASQIRPMSILHDRDDRVDRQSRGRATGAVVYFLAFIALFFLLVMTIIGNLASATIIVGGVIGVLFTLSMVFLPLVLATTRITHSPCPRCLVMSLVGACLFAGALARWVAPALGLLSLLLALICVAVVYPPPVIKAHTRMALRNIGRARARSVFLLLVVFVGVFCAGVTLVMGAYARAVIQAAPVTLVKYNSFVVSPYAQRQAVESALDHISDIQASVVNVVAQAVPVAIESTPVEVYLRGAPDDPTAHNLGRYQAEYYLSGVEGFTLDTSSLPTVRIIRGSQDARTGRNLTPSDRGATAVVMPYAASLAPLNLRLKEHFTIEGRAGSPPVTLTIVGFYLQNYDTFNSAPIFADQSVAARISNLRPSYIFSLRLPPARADAMMQSISRAVPSTQTFTLVDLVNTIDTLLANFTAVVTAIAALTLAASLIIVANAVGLSTFERRREIGILKALGFTSRQVVALVTVEYALLSLVAASLAMLLVIIGVTIAAKVILPVTATVSVPMTVGVVGLVTVICAVVVAGVAWSPAHLRPSDVLRQQ